MTLKRFTLYGIYNILKKAKLFEYNNRKNPKINIIIFHRIHDEIKDGITMSTRAFEKTIKWLSKKHKSISLGKIVDHIKNGHKFDNNYILITFDDGYMDNFEIAAPILKKFGMNACFFLTSGYIGTSKIFPWDIKSGNQAIMMGWNEARFLNEQGFEIGGHTVDHVDLGKEDAESAKYQVAGCKKHIEDKIGSEVNFFAYPFGRRNNIREDTMELIRRAGFQCCCSGYGGKVNNDTDLFNIHRIPAYPNYTELSMELDDFMTFYDGEMKINIPGTFLWQKNCNKK